MRNKSRGESCAVKSRFFPTQQDESRVNPYFTFHDSNLKLAHAPPHQTPSTRIRFRLHRKDKIIQQFITLHASTQKIETEMFQSCPTPELKPASSQNATRKITRYHTRFLERPSDRKPSLVDKKEKRKDEGIRGQSAQLSTRLEIRQDSKTKRNYLNQTNIEFSNKTIQRLTHKPRQQSHSISRPKPTPKKDQFFQAWQSMDMFALSQDLIHYTNETLQLASTSPLLTFQPENRHRKSRLRSKC